MRVSANRLVLIASFVASPFMANGEIVLEPEQITHGPQHHFFGYFGHVGTVPWNASGRYIVALRTEFQDRMPLAKEATEIVLIDTQNEYAVRPVAQTCAWNFQQGTMMYWNPDAPETQFFFNDRDPDTNKVFCVLFDIEAMKRLREYRFDDTPIGNSGVAQKGGYFLGINYGRLARLRPVTGYPDAYDWTDGVMHPEDDGVFRVDIASGEKRLLVSFKDLAERLRAEAPEVEAMPLFINHTLSNRDNDRIFFFARGNFGSPGRINVPFVCDPEGGGLTRIQPIGGHPEWGPGHTLVGRLEEKQVLYDTDTLGVTRVLGNPEIFPNPEGDIALSLDGRWFVNGY